MDTHEHDRTEIVNQIAWQVLRTSPLVEKKLLKMDIDQKDDPLPMSHIQVLAMLDAKESMSVSEISNAFGIAKPNITPLVDRLISSGLVKRERSNADRRVVSVVILDKGREKLNQIHEGIMDGIFDWGGGLSRDKLKCLSEALTSIDQILKSADA